MTDLPVPETAVPTAAERLAALRKPAEKRRKPAHTSKVLTAGISTTAMFALVAAMGWPSGTETAQSASLQTTTTAPVVPVIPVVPLVAPTSVPPTTVPGTRSTVTPVVPTVPVTAAPVVIPTATPVEQSPVQNASVRTASNTVTKSSG